MRVFVKEEMRSLCSTAKIFPKLFASLHTLFLDIANHILQTMSLLPFKSSDDWAWFYSQEVFIYGLTNHDG